MRLPHRVAGDYRVDRQEMYARQRVQSTCTNSPRAFFSSREIESVRDTSSDRRRRDLRRRSCCRKRTKVLNSALFFQVIYCGGYSGGDPPLPIPNREVKPVIADGTAPPGGRVGSCRSSESSGSIEPGLSLFIRQRRRLTQTILPPRARHTRCERT